MDIILGLGIALPVVTTTGISVTTGVAQGVQEQHKQNADASNQTRMLKFHLDVWVDAPHRKGPGASLHGGIVTIRDGKVWIEPKNSTTNLPEHMAKGSHPFTGFYLAYPDDNRSYTRGIVTTISVDPPMLNWMYIDKDSYECRVASRSGSIMHHVGDYDWTSDDNENSMVTFDELEGFVAVQEREEGDEMGWALYFDLDDDGLKGKRKESGKGNVVEVHLQRRVITGQEVNKWGLKEEGNMGFKATEEVNKLRKEKREGKEQGGGGGGDEAGQAAG
ncbi:hypothetical protein CLAFUW4_04303 [Fulvia fulva]|uniref:Uncharacterized protein n=1 Tax=Passalora fulva TaxID=5499 RepID=A0A9Q8LG02_PASFU|nr:uncharacterized protein CLAFUR5_04267 [Fulvia fulva]KAK4626053.1 hypothetical protein CLAFUR4_04289 [Fulvia fulva]KAK4627534.1 hypothetical protein CLAFUR0_04291 [Fulvia fulva]UJO16692.1 hypothetical protein CLAFUR5_04267 [Fulvia fulva]WPV14181.1 hypothetical protein CLAFUW4_04303 [Fulvia fulva]WPV28420.1 hypothetical protein CLAFUW7_04292 [Fulvia fulva]